MARRPRDEAPLGAPGRRLPGAPPPELPNPSPGATPRDAGDTPDAPFRAHQVDASKLTGAPDHPPARRAPFLIGATTLSGGLFAVLLVVIWLAEGSTPPPVTPPSPDPPRHIADEGYRGAIVDAPDPEPAAVRVPVPGPIKFFASAQHEFVSIEVDCPASGYQRRGRFFPEGKGRVAASVRDVPPDEKCRVTFQGTEVATTWAFAHETRDCVSFNPTVCPAR